MRNGILKTLQELVDEGLVESVRIQKGTYRTLDFDVMVRNLGKPVQNIDNQKIDKGIYPDYLYKTITEDAFKPDERLQLVNHVGELKNGDLIKVTYKDSYEVFFDMVDKIDGRLVCCIKGRSFNFDNNYFEKVVK